MKKNNDEVHKSEPLNSPIYWVVSKDKKKVYKVLEETAVCKYEQVPSDHPSEIPKVTVGEPTFVSPNRYKTCTEILRKIGKEAGIERCGCTQRKWIIVVCDGLPFKLCFNIIKETYMCAIRKRTTSNTASKPITK